MAHLENFKRGGVGRVLEHCSREAGDEVERSNENIDKTKTNQNYVVTSKQFQGKPKALASEYRSRVRKAVNATNEQRAHEGKKALYKSAAVMSNWVVTLPEDCPSDKARDFFKATVNFCVHRYGGSRVLGGFVHMDETSPHAHIPVLDILEDGTIDKSQVITRQDLRTFHSDLQDYCDKKLGFHVTVQLPEEEVLKKAKSKLTRDELDALNKHIKDSVASEVSQERQKLAEREKALESAYNKAVECLEQDVKDAYQAQKSSAEVVREVVEKFEADANPFDDTAHLSL